VVPRKSASCCLKVLLINVRSTRFIVFDKRAKIITEHQTEFQQILPHAGWHEQDPFDLVGAMRECMTKAVENLEWMGYSKDSIKGIGTWLLSNLVAMADEKESRTSVRLPSVGLEKPVNHYVTP
jgi:ribulose kinase